MSIKAILAPIDGSETSERVLTAAFQLAVEHGAHVDVLHVRANPKDAVPLLGEGMSGAVIEDIITSAEKEAAERAKRARAIFDQAVERLDVAVVEGPPVEGGATVTWMEETGREDEIAAARGRLADLIVVNRPTEDSSVSSTMTLNAVLVETGRPVFLVPPTGDIATPKRIAVSWNGSSEAGRAVTAALPVIERAENVLALTVDGDDETPETVQRLGRYLAWHGINMEMETTPVGEGAIGEAVLRECAEWNADLLVMGAYTHSRLRQLVFGGVTRHVLGSANLPVIMVH